MPKRLKRPDPLPATQPEPPRRVPVALAIQRDAVVNTEYVTHLLARRQTSVR